MVGGSSLFKGLKALRSSHLARLAVTNLVFAEDSLSELLNILLNVTTLRLSQNVHTLIWKCA